MSDKEGASPKPDKPEKAKTSPLVFVGILLSLVNLGATGYVVLRLEKPLVVKAKPTEGDGHATRGPTGPLDTFVVNLNERGRTRYLKTGLDVQVDEAETFAELEQSKVAIRDELLGYLSGLTVDETVGEESKKRIQSELQARIEKIVGAGKIKRLYFSEFVIQ